MYRKQIFGISTSANTFFKKNVLLPNMDFKHRSGANLTKLFFFVNEEFFRFLLLS